MCMISIPFESNSDRGAPLQRCIDRAAIESGVDVVTIALAMSHLLESVADEVARGHSVSVPGFGLFSPVPMPERHRAMSRDPSPRNVPRFSPSRGFRAQVAMGAAPNELEAGRFAKHQKNHSDRRDGNRARVFTAMESMRQQILAQLGGAREMPDSRPEAT